MLNRTKEISELAEGLKRKGMGGITVIRVTVRIDMSIVQVGILYLLEILVVA